MAESKAGSTTGTDSAAPTRGMSDRPTVAMLAKAESWLDRVSERLNPILVKESRQALKSRQFVITFALLLICAVLWSFFAVAQLTPAIYFAPAGKYLLAGYHWIMLFPLVVIVPFSAFRSLATEREDGTYELLTITALKSRQIVAGKLGSSVLQMIVYLSALAPCIAFTYLLRGVDVALILFAIVGTFMVSVLASAVGLLLATLTNTRHLQVVFSVVLILALAGVFFFVGIFFTQAVLDGFLSLTEPATLYVFGGLATAWGCLLTLVYLAASARIQFLSDNRSTSLRVAMFVSGLCIIGWFVWFASQSGVADAVNVMIGFSMVFWWLMGTFLIGERPELSPRARRDLPATFLGRVCLTWFQPGPGPGYFFAIANLTVCSLVAIGIRLYYSGSGRRSSLMWTVHFAVISVCYVAAYLGLGRLIVRSLRRSAEGPLLSFLISIILVAFGVLLPLIVQYSLRGTWVDGYGYVSLQVSNPFWTIADGLDRGAPRFGNGWLVSLVVAVEAAMLMMVVNFVLLARDLLPVRAAVPRRVAEEMPVDKKESKPTSPWDDSRES